MAGPLAEGGGGIGSGRACPAMGPETAKTRTPKTQQFPAFFPETLDFPEIHDTIALVARAPPC